MRNFSLLCKCIEFGIWIKEEGGIKSGMVKANCNKVIFQLSI